MTTLRRSAALPIAALILASAVALATASTPQKITAAGVGGVKLGTSYTKLHAQHLLGPLGLGCPLAGANAKSAQLKAPLTGFVDLTLSSPRKVSDIFVRGGATARGIGIGATIAQIKAKFPAAKVDHSTDKMFAATMVRIPKSDGGPFEFLVPTATHKTSGIGIPAVPVCE